MRNEHLKRLLWIIFVHLEETRLTQQSKLSHGTSFPEKINSHIFPTLQITLLDACLCGLKKRLQFFDPILRNLEYLWENITMYCTACHMALF